MATTKSKTEPTGLKPVIVCTVHKGVFFGYAPADARSTDPSIKLRDARMAMYWRTKKGVMQLAATGPTSASKISVKADIDVNAITALFDVTAEAEEAWKGVK